MRLASNPFPLSPALYRSRPELSRGRFIAEAPSASRSPFQRDRDRIIHAAAFRRLALKTQVFLPEDGDHYRTRLTHTIEVAQITRTITRALGLDDDLGEALALAHDLGHTPFGHTGEDALSEAVHAFGGFDHNAQTIRIVTFLERRYPSFPGLNLCWDTLEGLMKRGSGGSGPEETPRDWFTMGLPCFLDDRWRTSLVAAPRSSGEGQAAALADDIAYNAHDLEDGLQAGFFTLDSLDAVPLLRCTRNRLIADHPGIADDLLIRGLARELVGVFVDGALAESAARLAAERPDNADAIRHAARDLVALPAELAVESEAIKAFLFTHMYRHPRLVDTRRHAKRIVGALAEAMLTSADLLPARWRDDTFSDRGSEAWHARRVTDYVASMTDRFALAEYHRLFDPGLDPR